MKTVKIRITMKSFAYLLFALLLPAATLTACQEAVELQEVVYVTGTDDDASFIFTVDDPAGMGVTVTSTAKATKPIYVTLKTAPSLVAEYNLLHGTNYMPLPDKSYEFTDETVEIPAGKNVSKAAKFSITSVADFVEGTTYLMPVSIASVDGGLAVLEPCRTMYVVIKRTIHTRATKIQPAVYQVPSFQKDASLAAVPQVSMECRVRMHAWQNTKPYISSVVGLEEHFLLRFGDVTIDKNQLQLAGGGFPVTSNTRFELEKWYHLAVVYDGATITLYIDGVFDASVAAPRGPVDLTRTYQNGFFIGQSRGSRRMNGDISEVRVWTKALTPADLKNNVCFVDPTAEGLLAYWRFNETDGNDVPDLTGHGYTAKGTSAPTFVEGVKCPE